MIPSQTRNWFTLCQDCLLVLKCVFSFQTNRTWVGWRNALVLGSGGKTHSYLGRVAETGGETHPYLGRVAETGGETHSYLGRVAETGGETNSYLRRVAEKGGETHSYLGRVTKSETLCSEGMSAIHLVQLVFKV
jgi:hypothetical protein